MIFFSRFTALLQSTHSVFHPHIDLALENLALRQQLAAFKKKNPRPKLSRLDRILWVLLKLCWNRWRSTLLFVMPETVARWHRKGFKLYWKYISRKNKGIISMDFFTVPTLFFRRLYCFFIIHHDRRKILDTTVCEKSC